MAYFPRRLSIDLPPGRSAFLWGPRQTGKTTLLEQQFPTSLRFDLLKTDLRFELAARPHLLRERLLAVDPHQLAQPVVIDEIQKAPALLDEVHWLAETHGYRFILSGSSARKLKRGNVNLLGGRAWRYELFPLVYPELPEFDLLTVLNRGLIPSHYLEEKFRRSQKAYLQDYLKEEILAEGLTRNVPAFSRFFEAMAFSHGELTNFSNIARECGVDSKTVKEYYQILVDTLIGAWLPPFKRRQDRGVISRAAKFYLFDVGVAGSMTQRVLSEPRGPEFGRALEHLVFTELRAHSSYSELDYPIHFWRTKNGQEVDFILGKGEVAVEVKGSAFVPNRELRGLKAYAAAGQPKASFLVCNEKVERRVDGIRIIPIAQFLDELWSGGILSS